LKSCHCKIFLVLSKNLFEYNVIFKALRTITFYKPAINTNKFQTGVNVRIIENKYRIQKLEVLLEV
jgi:hypothetical protein